MANIAKHANASKVTIDLWSTPDRALLEIHDNGNGFELDKASKTVGHGLANMQTRVTNVGGDVDIITAPGEGTTILAWVPRTSVSRISLIGLKSFHEAHISAFHTTPAWACSKNEYLRSPGIQSVH